MTEKLLQWHPAFFAGIQIEFGEEAKYLEFKSEYVLGTKPMMIGRMCKALEELMKDKLEAKKNEGQEIGIKQGKERVNELTLKLSALGRIEDILKAASDEEYQEQLFREFGL